MAATGGVTAPLPPKRPTVIRPGVQGVPSRPAPPVPARKGDDNAPGKNAEPERPLPPPPPARPRNNRSSADSSVQPKPDISSTSNSIRRRPEITIVSARPMSEIVFRDLQASGTSQPKPSEPAKTNPEPVEIEAPKPTVLPPPRPQSSIQTADKPVGRAPPPRPTVIKPSLPPTVKNDEPKQPVRAPPPIPRHPSRPTAEKNETTKSSSVPSGAPVPIPRNVPVKHEKAESVNNAVVNDLVDLSVNDKTDNVNDNTDGVTEPMYCVIDKPKRPTIIRPNRPAAKEKSDAPAHIPPVPPKMYPSPTPVRKDNQDSSSGTSGNILSARKSFFESKQEKESVPEFLSKKLKPTVPSENDTNGKDPTATQSVNKPPPPAPKPKPTIVPKPKLAAKPTVAAKPMVHSSESVPQAEPSNDIEQNTDDAVSDKTSIESEVKKPFMVKRPTIIRPSRVVQSNSSENVGNVEQSDTKTESVTMRSSDDNLNKIQSRPQPPLPKKRPVSMVNIPDAIAQEELQSKLAAKSLQFVSSSTENIHKVPSSPSPAPRPMARPRPVSMMISSNTRPPLPSTGPRVQSKTSEAGSPPQRPQLRPSVPDHGPITEHKDNKPVSNAARMSTLGIAVLPRMEKKESTDLDPGKPVVRRPPPPKVTESSSSDEEFFTAQTKPDRPAGPPKARARTLSQDKSDDTPLDNKAPQRPIGVPAPRKSSMDADKNETSANNKAPQRPTGVPAHRKSSMDADKGESHNENFKGKPGRPDSKPPRPGGVPEKSPQPPRPGGARPRKKSSGAGLPPRPGPDHPLYRYMMQAPHGVALFDYNPRHEDELHFTKGEMILLKKVVDAEWLVGQVDGREGMFPKGFIKVKMPLPGQDFDDEDSSDDDREMFQDASPEKPDTIGAGPRCRARFDFEGEGVGDLPFEEGDMIKLLERVGVEWRKGECSGRVGVFPVVFVDVIEDVPEEDSEQSSNSVKAMFDFDGEPGDLSFQAGEIIQVKYLVSEEWLYGEIGERTGQFPIQFVDHVPVELPPMPSPQKKEVYTNPLNMWDVVDDKHPEPVVPEPKENIIPHKAPEKPKRLHSEEQPYCLALYDYPGETDDDLKFSTGDRIELVERVNADWLKGCCHGRTGMFPAAFVDVKVDVKDTVDSTHTENPDTSYPTTPHTDTQEPLVHIEMGVAQYDFVGEGDNELTFTSGARIELQEYVTGAEDWRYGVLVDGKRGIFPAAFVLPES